MRTTGFDPSVLVFALCTSGPAVLLSPVASAQNREAVTTSAAKTLSPREEAIISSAGVKVLRHIAQARADLRNDDTDGARQELDRSERLLDVIRTGLPTTRIKDPIWAAKKHRKHENTGEVVPDLIPIYTSLNELYDIVPTEITRKQLDQAKAPLKAGNREKTGESLDATAEALAYTEVDLPLSGTRQLVTQAMADLNRKAPVAAGKSLKSAEDNVVFLSVAFEQPLITARSLMWQSVLDMKAGNKERAGSDLDGAVGYLEIASKSDDKPTREVAADLLPRARELRADIDAGPDIEKRVRRLWERTRALAERSVEYLSTGWSRYRADRPVKSDVIEAKLHIAYAGIDLRAGHDADAARNELSAAAGFLDKALGLFTQEKQENPYQQQIARIQGEVKDLSRNSAAGQAPGLDAIQQQLRNMIRTL